MLKRLPASGALFAIAWFAFADGVVLAFQDPDSAYHPTFLHVVPGLAATVGFIMLNLTSAAVFAHSRPTNIDAAGILVGSWIVIFASIVGALWICATDNVVPSTRQSPALGIAIVVQCTMLALSATFFWARHTAEIIEFE